MSLFFIYKQNLFSILVWHAIFVCFKVSGFSSKFFWSLVLANPINQPYLLQKANMILLSKEAIAKDKSL